MKTGSISLASTLILPSEGAYRFNGNTMGLQLLCNDLSTGSTGTTYYLELSADGESWDNAVENGTDISDTLVASGAKFQVYQCKPEVYWRVRFATGSTGTVSYAIL